MFYEKMPLYPGMKPAADADSCMKVRLFDDGCGRPCRPPAMRECERVTIENPCRRGERAEVVLGVDDCGNLVICVHRIACDPCDRMAESGGSRHHDWQGSPWPGDPRPDCGSCRAPRRRTTCGRCQSWD